MILDYFAYGHNLVLVECFPGADELMAVLDVYDPQTLTPPTFLYRGQSGRFFRRWPPEDTIDTPADSYTLDSIIPSDYRYIESLIRAGQKSDHSTQLVHSNHITVLRALAVYVAIGVVNLDSAQRSKIDNWFSNMETSAFCNHLLSIGQHCGLPTGYSDVTSDKRVALWFATHNWCSGDYISGEHGIIYRINYNILALAQEAINMMRDYTELLACRTIDIRSVPQELTPRPHLQHGFSLAGFESPWLLMELIRREGIEGYIFKRGPTVSSENTIQKIDIAPTDDPVYVALNNMRDNNAYDQDFQQQVDVRFQDGHLGAQQYDVKDTELRRAIFDGWLT